MKILSLTKYEKLGASSRIRTFQYLPLLKREGYEVSPQSLITDKSLLSRYKYGKYSVFFLVSTYIRRIKVLFAKQSYDLVWVEKEAFPWFPVWFELLLLRGKPFIMDFDDATFHNYDQHSNKFLRYFYHNRLDKLMAKSALVICGNYYLKQRAENAGASRTVLLPTVVNLNSYSVKDYNNPKKRFNSKNYCKIVWIGSPSTQHYLQVIKKPLQILSKKYNIILRVIGSKDLKMPSVNLELIPWSEEEESRLIRDCDIGVMPLLNTSWEKGKCGYKLIQYMASGLPVVASPIGINRDIVCHGDNGFLVSNQKQWIRSLSNLVANKSLRSRLGLNGRQHVLKKYSLINAAPKLIESFKQVYERNNNKKID